MTVPSLEELISTARLVSKTSLTFSVHDVGATVRWYRAIGFTLEEEYEERSELSFARLACGEGDFMLSPGGPPGPREGTLQFVTDRVELLYDAFRERQIPVEEELHTPASGGRQFSIRDPNGLTLIFWQPSPIPPSAP